MRLSHLIFIAVASCTIFTARAQDTNVITLYTRLEGFEAQTGKIIVKAWASAGTVSVNNKTISVGCKESTEVGTGRKAYGVTVGIKEGGLDHYRTVIDDDELDSFLEAIDYVSKVDMSVTVLPNFQATYKTRADLRLLSYNSAGRAGTVQALQTGYNDANRIVLAPDQLGEFRILIRSAKEKLDALKKL